MVGLQGLVYCQIFLLLSIRYVRYFKDIWCMREVLATFMWTGRLWMEFSAVTHGSIF